MNEKIIHNYQPEPFYLKNYHTSFDISSLPDPTPENFSKLVELLPKFGLDQYLPNLESKQNKRKILDSFFRAYGAVNSIMYEFTFKDCPQGLRKKMFGSLSNDLSRYLDNFLIIRENDHKRYDPNSNEKNGESYRYRANAVAMELVARILISSSYVPKLNKAFLIRNGMRSPVIEHSMKAYMADIEDKFKSGDLTKQKDALTGYFMVDAFSDEFLNGFKYTTSAYCPRLFHICQNIRKDLKHELFSAMGYAFDYDVQSAAPTFLYQAALAVNPELEGTLVTIRDYILNTKAIRSRIAADYNMDYDVVKKMINARFAGANMTVNREHSLFNMVHCNRDLMEKLKEDDFFVNLKAELKVMWDTISKSKKYSIFFNQNERLKSKDKWKFYFSMESNFIKFVEQYLANKGNKSFLEHDGFRSDMPINTNDLEEAYYQHSGIMLKILPNMKNPCSYEEFTSRVKSMVCNPKMQISDVDGLVTYIGKVHNVSEAQSVLKNQFKSDANNSINDFLGSFINQILDGKFNGISSEDIIKELTGISSSSTKKIIRNTAADITPIDSIVMMVKDGMTDEVKKDRFSTIRMRRKTSISG